MPTCMVCDSEEFELTDGLYFCKMCCTQTQEIVEQGFDDTNTVQMGRAIRVRREKKKDKHIDRGKPWYTVEAYQVILKAQVAALVKLGVTTQLKDIVKQIWFKYLQLSGYCVVDQTTSKLKPLSLMTFRDEYLNGVLGSKCNKKSLFPTTKNSMRLKVPTRRTYKHDINSSSDDDDENYETRGKKRKTEKPKKLLENSLRSDEEWFSLASESSSDSKDDVEDSLKSKYTRIDRRTNGRDRGEVIQLRSKISFLTITKLLAIIQIGLKWCQEYITTGDLILWIQQGYLPYIDCLYCLPPHMKLTNFDLNIQNKPIPTYQKMAYLQASMSKFVEMPEIAERSPFHLIVRYILELNLPKTLLNFIYKLTLVVKFERDSRHKNIPEVEAISLIIISLKLLCGLDEKREWTNDINVVKCEKHMSDCDPFIWKTWVYYHLQRRSKNQSNPANTFHMKDVNIVDDIQSYVEHWNNLLIASTLICKEEGGNKISTSYKKDTAQCRTEVFIKMAELNLDELEFRRDARNCPQVSQKPTQDLNMMGKCLQDLVNKLAKDPDYIWYADKFSRLENFSKRTKLSCQFELVNDALVKGQLKFHKTYDFVLTLASEITCACKPLIHTVVQDVERSIIAPYLEARKEQKHLFTEWESFNVG